MNSGKVKGEESDKKMEDEDFDSWNPMADHFHSVQNLVGGDMDEDAGAFLLGVKAKKKTWSETPCPHYYGTGPYCYKGPSCRMKHESFDPISSEKKGIKHILDMSMKRPLHFGMWMKVAVKHVVSPSEFYVIPNTPGECICEGLFPVKEIKVDEKGQGFHANQGDMNPKRDEDDVQQFGTGLEAFEAVSTYLKNILEANMRWRHGQSSRYAYGDLVAVKVTENGTRRWFRGAVLDKTPKYKYASDDQRELPWQYVQLFDVGQSLPVRGDDMCALPSALSTFAALAYKCCLNNVVPVGGWTWTAQAIDTFKNLTAGQDLLIFICARSDEFTEKLEEKPYQVALLVPNSAVPEELRPNNLAPKFSITAILTQNGMAKMKEV